MTVDDALELFYRAAHAETDSELITWYAVKTGRAGPIPRADLGSFANRLEHIIVVSVRDSIREALQAIGEAFQAAGMVADAKEYLHELCEGIPPYPVDVRMRSGVLIEGVRSDIWDAFRDSMRCPEQAIGLGESPLRRVHVPAPEHRGHRRIKGREVTADDQRQWERDFETRMRKMKRQRDWHKERARWIRLQRYALEDSLDLARAANGIAGHTLSVIDIAPKACENRPISVIGNAKRVAERSGVKSAVIA